MDPHTLTIPVGPEDHVQGSESAPVTLVEYGDYECSFCGEAYPLVKDLQERMGDRLRFVFRNFPLSSVHPEAELGAESAEAAGAQGKYWEMHDLLYEHQQQLGPDLVLELGEQLGIDVKRFEEELVARKYRDHVQADFMGGVRSGVNGTPTFFINGRRFDGNWSGDGLLVAIEKLLGTAR